MSYNCEKSYCLCVVFIWYLKDIKHIILKPVFDRFADQISVDDDVLVHENGKLIPAKVTRISDMELQGWGKSYTVYILWIIIQTGGTAFCNVDCSEFRRIKKVAGSQKILSLPFVK